MIQTMTDVAEERRAYSFLYQQLAELVGSQAQRPVLEFCGYNAEELVIKRTGENTISIVVAFNLKSDNANQFLLFGVTKESDAPKPAFVIHLSENGEMSYELDSTL